MSRKNWLFLGALLVAALATTSQAQAGWRHHHHGSSGGSWGSSGGSWGSSGGSWGSSGGSWGSSGGYSYYGSWGSSGGSWGSSGGSSGGSWGSSGGHYASYGWGSSGGSSGGHAAYRVVEPNPGQPADGAAPAGDSRTPPAPPAGDTNPGDAAPAELDSTYHPAYGPVRSAVTLSVKVPADAKVFVNNIATTSTGTDRTFISRGLKPGARYNYEVRAELVRDGETLTETKSVQLTVGGKADLAFNLNGNAQEQTAATPAPTKLTVHVPADAKLFLAGQETRSTGAVREFVTRQLSGADQWSTYTIRAVIERDGQTVSKDQTISLKAGEEREVRFDFDATNVAGQVADAVSR